MIINFLIIIQVYMFEIVNVIICYNNGEEVVKYIDEMKNHDCIEKVCFVITINAGRDEDISFITNYIEETKLNVILFSPNENLGYLNGLIQGYRYFRESNAAPRFVVMSNTDITIPNISYYKDLIEKNYDECIGCIGPSVFVGEKNTYDNPVEEKRRSLQEMNRIIMLFSVPLFRGLYVYLSTIKGYFKKNMKTDSRYVYEVHGCYFILTRKFAEIIKTQKYGALMYSEETYIAELIYRYNFREYYDADIEVIHLEHSTTKFVKCSKIAKYIKESMKYIRDEFYL